MGNLEASMPELAREEDEGGLVAFWELAGFLEVDWQGFLGRAGGFKFHYGMTPTLSCTVLTAPLNPPFYAPQRRQSQLQWHCLLRPQTAARHAGSHKGPEPGVRGRGRARPCQ